MTKGHALFIDGVLVPAENLINDTTITLYEAREYDELEYFHIKLESHDVIYAEGAPCETLLRVKEDAVNFAEYIRRYGAPEKEEASCVRAVSLSQMSSGWRGTANRVMLSPDVGRLQIAVVAAHRVIPITSVT